MCSTCGCGGPNRVTLDVHTSLLSKNDRDAALLRAHFALRGCLALNLMGSPGSGKTAILEATARALPNRRMAAVSGDLATALDAERLGRAGLRAAAITTGTACHLDAAMVHASLRDVDLTDQEIFFIENVGNLVCPAIYDLGQAANVVVLSVTEGVDKPLKYPVMFQHAQLVLLTKIDLLPYLGGVGVDAIAGALAQVMPKPVMLPVSASSGEGMDAWIAWVEARIPAPRVFVAGGSPSR